MKPGGGSKSLEYLIELTSQLTVQCIRPTSGTDGWPFLHHKGYIIVNLLYPTSCLLLEATANASTSPR